MADFGPIGGNLSFQGGGKDYASAYQQALSMNQQNYNNILQGYQNTLTNQQNAQGRIAVGYQNLQSNVLGSIAGIDRSQRQDIADQYARSIGDQSQSLINRGLGNSTIQSSVARGALYDKSKADIALTNSTQGLNAQYMSNLGLAGLNYQGQALNANTAQANQQLNWMNSVNAGYPDMRSYAELARMKGASSGGGMFGGGTVSQGGAVKSPLGAGGGYNAPNMVSYGSGFGYGGVRAPASTPETFIPEGDWWDLGGRTHPDYGGAVIDNPVLGGNGMDSGSLYGGGLGAGGNQGGGGFFDPFAGDQASVQGDGTPAEEDMSHYFSGNQW